MLRLWEWLRGPASTELSVHNLHTDYTDSALDEVKRFISGRETLSNSGLLLPFKMIKLNRHATVMRTLDLNGIWWKTTQII